MTIQRFAVAAGLSVFLLLVHLLVVPYIVVVHVVPDIILIFVIYLAIRDGQVAGTIAGFLLGLVVDLLGGEGSVLGLSALVKSITGFVAGYSFSEARTFQTLGGYRFPVIVGACALLHNVMYFLIYLQGSGIGFGEAIVVYAVPAALYTVLVSIIPMFFFSRHHTTA